MSVERERRFKFLKLNGVEYLARAWEADWLGVQSVMFSRFNNLASMLLCTGIQTLDPSHHSMQTRHHHTLVARTSLLIRLWWIELKRTPLTFDGGEVNF